METVCFDKTCVGIVVFVMPHWVIPPFSWTIITILTIFEIAFMLLFTFTLTLAIMIISKQSSIFHPNMTRMATFLLTHFYFYIISRLTLLFYQFEVLKFKEKVTFAAIIVIASSMLRVYTAFSIVFVFLEFVVERFFASIYVRDYETKHRSWIAFFGLPIVIILSVVNSCDITFSLFKFPGVTAPIALFVMMLSAGLMSIGLFFYNKRRLRALIKRSEQYTFSERYQLDENIRAFKFLLLIAGTASICGCSCFLIMILRVLNFDDKSFAAVSGAAFDLCLSIVFNVWLSVILYKQPVWREEFVTTVLAILGKPRKEAPRRSKTNANKILGMEGDIYFRDLSGSWDAQFERKRRNT